jgi:hypothetical protein
MRRAGTATTRVPGVDACAGLVSSANGRKAKSITTIAADAARTALLSLSAMAEA